MTTGRTRELDLNSRLAGALERIAHAVRALRQDQASAHGLTPLQVDLLLHLAHRDAPERRRAARLAELLDLAPPTVSDALAALARKGHLKRRRDETDGRSSVIVLTASGRRLSGALALETGLDEAVAGLDSDDRATTLASLLEIITVLHRRGVISVARTCLTCRFMISDGDGRRCTLLGIALDDTDLRVDCPEHAPEVLASTST
jgi:DNA-binding MarR family transcriptional regulator